LSLQCGGSGQPPENESFPEQGGSTRDTGARPPCLISLAKQEEEIYWPGDAEPMRLGRHAAALRLLQYFRDEAHRFAQQYHHLLRRKKYEE
jgi:excinuclease ABC subunit C